MGFIFGGLICHFGGNSCCSTSCSTFTWLLGRADPQPNPWICSFVHPNPVLFPVLIHAADVRIYLSNKSSAFPQSSSQLPWIINAVLCPKCRQQFQLQLDIGITSKSLMGIIVCHTGNTFQPQGMNPQELQHPQTLSLWSCWIQGYL